MFFSDKGRVRNKLRTLPLIVKKRAFDQEGFPKQNLHEFSKFLHFIKVEVDFGDEMNGGSYKNNSNY